MTAAMRVTLFRDVGASKLDAFDWTADELAEQLKTAKTYPSKADCPLIKLAVFGNQRSEKGSLRHDRNVVEITGIEADYDAGQVTMAEAQMKLCDHNVSAILYTSPSHTVEKPRWRVLCPLSRPYQPNERAQLVGRLNGALGGILAPESFVLSQSYYAGRVNGAAYEVGQVRGEYIDQLPALDAIAVVPVKAGESKAERLEKIRSTDPVMLRLAEKNLITRQRMDGGADIICPFEAQHTTPRAPADCSYFAPNTGGFANGHFKCLHSHCATRSDEDFRKAIGLTVAAADHDERNPPPEGAPLPTRTTAPAIDWAKLAGREPPERQWAVKGWFGFGHTSLLVGPGGIGKTLLAQQLASCLALGKRFIGDVPEPLTCLMWACEDDHDELWRRQVAIGRWLGADLDAFKDLVIVPRHGHNNALVATDYGRLMVTPLLAELGEQAADLSADVVILDNAAQLYGGSENDRHSVTAFLNALAGALPGRAIMLLAHPARAAGSEYSGSSAWENTARTRLYLDAKLPDQKADTDETPDDSIRYLARRKANYSNKDWRRFNYNDGVLVPEAVEATGGIVGHLRDQAAERVVLAALKRLQEMSLHPTDGTTSPRYLPRMILEYKLGDGHGRAELAQAVRRLMLDGRLLRDKVGKNTNRTPIYGLLAS